MAGQKDFYKKGDQISGSEHKEPQGSHSARPLLLLLVGRQVALDPPLHVHVFAGFWSVADADIHQRLCAAKWHNNSVSFSACNAISCCHILSAVSSSTKNCELRWWLHRNIQSIREVVVLLVF